MDITTMVEQIKQHPDYHKAGMILCHNGVVRATSREGDEVTGLEVVVDHDRLDQILEEQKKRPGIIDILIHINEKKELAVGDDVMFLVVAGDIRDNVLESLKDTLNLVKAEATSKKQYFKNEK
ncbi:MAG: molybdenum cofactor biosynthesis protein MoaE [Desulfobacula sp.]|uniref:molybdenum cofactor biosynthesis protein MoaE n=1 Tax=Desulfobacula sp. TaxID=2593537 RepID=UPI0025C5B350|nr:molybdenum cofactor biosynthesis protein MoaE [Desulfobacula sp.]MCD4718696.1 molybdenum cofactor biosynthesis protein MoaE [Desulfobacula sp.]